MAYKVKLHSSGMNKPSLKGDESTTTNTGPVYKEKKTPRDLTHAHTQGRQNAVKTNAGDNPQPGGNDNAANGASGAQTTESANTGGATDVPATKSSSTNSTNPLFNVHPSALKSSAAFQQNASSHIFDKNNPVPLGEVLPDDMNQWVNSLHWEKSHHYFHQMDGSFEPQTGNPNFEHDYGLRTLAYHSDQFNELSKARSPVDGKKFTEKYPSLFNVDTLPMFPKDLDLNDDPVGHLDAYIKQQNMDPGTFQKVHQFLYATGNTPVHDASMPGGTVSYANRFGKDTTTATVLNAIDKMQNHIGDFKDSAEIGLFMQSDKSGSLHEWLHHFYNLFTQPGAPDITDFAKSVNSTSSLPIHGWMLKRWQAFLDAKEPNNPNGPLHQEYNQYTDYASQALNIPGHPMTPQAYGWIHGFNAQMPDMDHMNM